MPTNRTFRPRLAVFDFSKATSWHLLTGDCLVAGPGRGCGCKLRGADGQLITEAAAHQWAAHKREAMKLWSHPFPSFSAVLFDGATLPDKPDPKWSAETARWLEIVTAEVERARST